MASPASWASWCISLVCIAAVIVMVALSSINIVSPTGSDGADRDEGIRTHGISRRSLLQYKRGAAGASHDAAGAAERSRSCGHDHDDEHRHHHHHFPNAGNPGGLTHHHRHNASHGAGRPAAEPSKAHNQFVRLELRQRFDLKPIELSDGASHYVKNASTSSLEVRLNVLAQHDAARLQALNTQINDAIAVRAGHINGRGSQFSPSARYSVNVGPGTYVMQLTLGTPPRTFPLIMDTGSQLVWMQCNPCTSCVAQTTPPFTPSASSSYQPLPCSSPGCKSLPGQCDGGGECSYTYSYASQASTQGALATETLTLSAADGSSMSFPGLAFGCGLQNQGDYGGASGLVGMGQSELSLPSQLGKLLGGRKFSYCLVPNTFPSLTQGSASASSPLLLGDAALTAASSFQGFTPMVSNPAVAASLYYISVLGFSVAGQRLSVPASTFAIAADGSGGMIIDSGTTYTYISQSAFLQLQQAFDSLVRLSRYTSHPFLPVCYSTATAGSSPLSSEIPPLTLHLQGLDLALPLANYFIPVDAEGAVHCLAITPISSGGGLQILGNLLHQGYQVLYDLDAAQIGFGPPGGC